MWIQHKSSLNLGYFWVLCACYPLLKSLWIVIRLFVIIVLQLINCMCLLFCFLIFWFCWPWIRWMLIYIKLMADLKQYSSSLSVISSFCFLNIFCRIVVLIWTFRRYVYVFIKIPVLHLFRFSRFIEGLSTGFELLVGTVGFPIIDWESCGLEVSVCAFNLRCSCRKSALRAEQKR